MTLRQLLRKPFVTGFYATPSDLSGKHIIVTGASVGSLGYATAWQLAQWGATVVITTRHDAKKISSVLNAELDKDSIDGYNLDLSTTASVNEFTDWYQENYGQRLDCLINNAGIHLDLLSQWKEPKQTADGFEIQWRTNYLGTVQLTHSLLPTLKKTGKDFGEARVVNVVSQLHSRGSNELLFDRNRIYESWQAYGLSKLSLIHFSNQLHRRFSHTDNVKSFSLHPGGKSGVYTNVASKGLEGHNLIGLFRTIGAPLEKLFMTTADEGAQTQIHCAVSSEAQSGHYYVNGKIANSSDDSNNENAANRLWEETDQWLNSA